MNEERTWLREPELTRREAALGLAYLPFHVMAMPQLLNALSVAHPGLTVGVANGILYGLAAVFTALGWYQKLAAKAGAGTLVPITGFANAVVSPAIEFKTEGWINGTGAKMFQIAGPVIVYGMAASVAYGVICWVTRMFRL